MSSRWADAEADALESQRRKKEKEEKKRLKLQKQKEQQESTAQDAGPRPSKRRRLSNDDTENEPPSKDNQTNPNRKLLRFPSDPWTPCRHTSNFETLNHIEEGSYGWVSRARDITTGQIVALKKIKMDAHPGDGFPITALREIAILQRARHENVIELQEILTGGSSNEVILVMPFFEHDLKTLQEDMAEPFLASETKTLLRQLTSALAFLHANFILHRDLKTSNILLSNRGHLKIADFGMARYMPPSSSSSSSPAAAAPLTQLVVTLWYRAPELLLGADAYGAEIDVWSLGCIFAELLRGAPVLPGKNEVDELALVFALCGVPTEKSWPGFWRLPNAKGLKIPRDSSSSSSSSSSKTTSRIRDRFPSLTTEGLDLLSSMLALNPALRPTADEVLKHPYFSEAPKPKPMELFPTFPSKAGQERRRRRASPNAPKRGDAKEMQDLDFTKVFAERELRVT